jgi:hypothetical protein
LKIVAKPAIVRAKENVMGIGPFSSSRGEEMYSETKPVIVYVDRDPPGFTGNPNPSNYRILRSEQVGSALVVEIKYPDCQNYEGHKILVFTNFSIEKLLAQKIVDPHFFKSTAKLRAPVARFEPTEQGWKYAKSFANSL